jgi:hypothetical protein
MDIHLHVRKNGTECEFSAKPEGVKTFPVKRIGGDEFAWTDHITLTVDATGPVIVPRPRGASWVVWSQTGTRTQWHRSAKRSP